MTSFARAFDSLPVTGLIRHQPEDFVVDEMLGFSPSGEGEHLWLQVHKRGINTQDVAREIARHVGVPVREVGYSGLKDRKAVATQWFSVQIGESKQPDWSTVNSDTLRIVQSVQHHRKLRRGTHRGNRFRIMIREVNDAASVFLERLEQIRRLGVPNYFGPQRFGYNGNNLRGADRLFAGLFQPNRMKRGLYLSAARSWMFNKVLSERVVDGSWNRLVPGDLAMLDGTHSVFQVDIVDAKLLGRVETGDVHPTGPLAGGGDSTVKNQVETLEAGVLAEFKDWCEGLVRTGLRHERRALRLWIPDLSWSASAPSKWTLEFTLPRGQFATAVLRECGSLSGER